MMDWLSPQELADLALPGLPASARGWRDWAERNGWDERAGMVRARAGRGGGLEYHIELLPPESLAVYAARAVGLVDATKESAAGCDEQLSLPMMESRDARMALLSASDRLAREGSMSHRTADRLFAALYNIEKIEVAPWVRTHIKQTSAKSIERWRMLAKRDKSRLGLDRGAARRGKGALDVAEGGKVKAYILAHVAHQPHLSADHVRTLVADHFTGLELPSKRTFQAYLTKLKADNGVLLTRVTNPDKFKSAFRVSGANSHPVMRLNELWQIDASPADALCVDGRHSVYVCIDIFSRRLCIYLSRTPRAEAVGLLMRKAILEWGAPERLKLDNGSDFIAKASQRLFASLEIEVEFSAPFSPEQKGHVERAIGSMQRDLMPLLPGFIGHSVKDRKVIEERKAFSARLGQDDARAFGVELTAKELQAYLDDWARGRYAARPHSGIDGVSPQAKAASYAGKIRRVADERALDLLLAPLAGADGLRMVGKQGVRIDGSFYLPTTVLPGDRVFVRMDPADLGRAFLFSPDGENFLGEAVCPELAGVDPAEAVARAKAAQKALLEEGTKELRAGMRRIKPRDMAEAVLRQGALESGKLAIFPRPVEAHETPALAAAKEALSPIEEVKAYLAEKATEEAPSTSVVRLPETKQQRFKRALELEAAIARGERIPTDQALWLGGYQAGAEYAAFKALFEDYGEQALK
jgi:putative transposase